MRTALTLPFHCLVGVSVTLLSTFVGERSGLAVYSDILGCEHGCVVVATGWPIVFVSDYLGMSVVNTADILEVWFAADRFSWVPFLVKVGVWTSLSLVAIRGVLPLIQRGSPPHPRT